MTTKKRFRMFAGPNGSGKSTLYERLRKDSIIRTDIYLSDDRSYLVDNSLTIGKTYDVVAEIEKGKKFKAVKDDYDFKKKLPAFYKAYKKRLEK